MARSPGCLPQAAERKNRPGGKAGVSVFAGRPRNLTSNLGGNPPANGERDRYSAGLGPNIEGRKDRHWRPLQSRGISPLRAAGLQRGGQNPLRGGRQRIGDSCFIGAGRAAESLTV